jgi:hypothetical protein
VVDDIDKLLLKEAWIDRVTDQSTARNAKVAFQVPCIVPRDRRNAIALEQTQFGERGTETPRPIGNAFPCCPCLGTIRFYGHDLGVAMVAGTVVYQRMDRQWHDHHLSAHVVFSSVLNCVAVFRPYCEASTSPVAD